jgi:hypothetical protein
MLMVGIVGTTGPAQAVDAPKTSMTVANNTKAFFFIRFSLLRLVFEVPR